MTKLPRSVGHLLSDVEEQLRFRVPGPGGKTINSPRGFVDNFFPRVNVSPKGSEGVVQNDVLGFYDHVDLPFFELSRHQLRVQRPLLLLASRSDAPQQDVLVDGRRAA